MIILPAIFKIKPGENHKTVAHTQKPFLQHLTTFCAIRFHRVVREFRGPLRDFPSPLYSSWQATFKFRYTLLADVLPSKSIHHTWLTGQMMYAGFTKWKAQICLPSRSIRAFEGKSNAGFGLLEFSRFICGGLYARALTFCRCEPKKSKSLNAVRHTVTFKLLTIWC